MKRLQLLITFFIFANICHGFAEDWNAEKSTHFIVYYKNAPGSFIRELVDKAEGYYNGIADDLGFRRYNFWLWENRASIYVYDDAAAYQSVTHQPAWSSGCAYPEQKIIHTFPYATDFFGTVLPHEMGHIIFRELVGFQNRAIPIWLDEGVASYEQDLRFSGVRMIAKEAMLQDKFMGLKELSGFNPQSSFDPSLVRIFYAESISVVEYLVKEFGQDSFLLFCQKLRDDRDLEKALSGSYPFANIEELDEAWQKFLEK
ncbi:MAG: peptidase MA family metallohydrolase [Deltaproteobacteria bacterium]